MLERLSKTHRNLALLAIALLLGWFSWTVRAVLNPLILGYLLAYILRPMVQRLEDRGIKRRNAVNIIFILFGLSLLAIFGGVLIQGRQFVNGQVELAQRGEDPFSKAERNLDALLGRAGGWFDKAVRSDDGEVPPGDGGGAGGDAVTDQGGPAGGGAPMGSDKESMTGEAEDVNIGPDGQAPQGAGDTPEDGGTAPGGGSDPRLPGPSGEAGQPMGRDASGDVTERASNDLGTASTEGEAIGAEGELRAGVGVDGEPKSGPGSGHSTDGGSTDRHSTDRHSTDGHSTYGDRDVDHSEMTVRQIVRAWLASLTKGETGETGYAKAQVLLGYVQRIFGGVLSVLGFLFLLPVYTYFLLFELERIHTFVRSHVPKQERERVARIGRNVGAVIANFFRGRLLISILKGLIIAVGLTILGVPYGFLLGIFAGLFSLVPFVGPTVGFGLTVLVALQQADIENTNVWLSLGLLVGIFLLAEGIEGYILVPKILGDSLGLHPVVILVSVFVGGAALGLFGFLIAIPLAATLIILFKELVMPALEDFAEEDSHTDGSPVL